MMTATVEFRSPDFLSSVGLVFLGILLVVLAALGVRRSRLHAPTLLIFPATVALSLRSWRYISLFGGQGHPRQYIADEFSAKRFPTDAVRFARVNPVGGRLFNDYLWGGYRTLAWPEQRVFIDGLADFYGNRIFRDYRHVAGLKPGWRDVLDRWNIELVLVPADSGVAAELVRESSWHELYLDDVAALLQRKR